MLDLQSLRYLPHGGLCLLCLPLSLPLSLTRLVSLACTGLPISCWDCIHCTDVKRPCRLDRSLPAGVPQQERESAIGAITSVAKGEMNYLSPYLDGPPGGKLKLATVTQLGLGMAGDWHKMVHHS